MASNHTQIKIIIELVAEYCHSSVDYKFYHSNNCGIPRAHRHKLLLASKHNWPLYPWGVFSIWRVCIGVYEAINNWEIFFPQED